MSPKKSSSSSSSRPQRQDIMLAYPVIPSRLAKLSLPFFAQPKLNGERCWVEWFAGEPVLLSSYGNEFTTLTHIKEAILGTPPLHNIRFDGELYIHGEPFETIHSICSREKTNPHPRVKEISLHVFDFKSTNLKQHERFEMLKVLSKFFPDCLTRVQTVQSDSIGAWLPFASAWIAEGYEGAILRDAKSLYTERRTTALLKYKPTETDEYTIVSVEEGKGWAENHLGSFLVKDADGRIFNVGSGKLLTKDTRKHLWANRGDLPGKILIVKHDPIHTSSGIPRCAVAVDLK